MKNYLGFSRDHSGSMSTIAKAAARDYNSQIVSIRDASIKHNQTTIVSVVECGYGYTDRVRRVITNSAVTVLEPLNENQYSAKGRGTPLWDSVGELIEIFEAVPDKDDKEVSFLITVTTDGEENSSCKYSITSIISKMTQLQNTDRWSFVFRVPRGAGRKLARLGIPEGNILEWDQTQRGVEVASQATSQAFDQYFTDRAAGKTATRKFYADLSNVTSKDVVVALTDISKEVLLWPVSINDDGTAIRDFVEERLHGEPLLKGAAFYQLTKTEPEVQDHKRIIIRDKTTNAIYEGVAARQMLGLPSYGTIRLAPGNFGNFDLFIQSTSVNRKMTKGTNVIYWSNVGKRYKSGPSK